MNFSKKKGILLLITFFIFIIIGISIYISVQYYSLVFSVVIKGEVLRVERVITTETVILGPKVPTEQIFSFALAIRDFKDEIHTASSEDRQWAIVKEKQCVEAKFFPYPPWKFEKSGTYYGARLLKLFDCKP